MAAYACIVQEGQAPDGLREELSRGLHRIGRDLLDDPAGGAEITWIAVREGFGFTAGAPSTSSLVARSLPVGFPDDRRAELMSRICDLWQEVMGCTRDEIVVTALDGALPL